MSSLKSKPSPSAQIPLTKQPLKTRGVEGNTQMWLKDMSERDTKLWGLDKPLWICDNKIYDLTQFAQKHPGGRNWIEMTKGQDITLSFKTHHMQEEKVRKIMEKYYVGPTKIKHEPRFDFQETGHYNQIRKRVLAKFSVADLQDSSRTQKICYSIVVLWFILVSIMSYLRSYTLAVLCGLSMMVFYGIGHLFIHRKDSNNYLKHAFLLIGFSAREQRIMHVVSHHPYANTMLDYQYAALEPIMNYSRCMPVSKWYSAILIQILFALIGPINVITKLLVVPLMTRSMISFQHIVLFLEIGYIYLFAGDWAIAFKLWLLMMVSYGVLLGKTVTCPHRQIQLWSEGALEIRDFLLHMIATTADTNHSLDSQFLSLILYSGFNIHVLHHLFPTMDQSKLYECNKILVQYCQEKGLKIYVADMFNCNKDMYKLEVDRKQFDLKFFLKE